MGSGVRHPSPWQVAALVTALALAWQWLIVQGYFEGQWNALFLASARFSQAPAVRAESPRALPDSYGYDGQFYHAVAHDPLDLRGTDHFLDAPQYRYYRILLPALSYILGFGQLFWIDRAFRALELAFLFLGVLCAGAWAVSRRQSAWWGALFASLPGVFMSLERQLIELPACALLTAALFCHDRKRDKLCWLSLACAGLTREVGLVAIVAFVFAASREKQFGRARYWAFSAIPMLLWYVYVLLFIPRGGIPVTLQIPLLPILAAPAHLDPYPFGPLTVLALHVLDLAALAGLLLSFIMALRGGIAGTLACVSVALATLGIALSGFWVIGYNDVYGFARQDSPLLAVQLLQSLQTRDRRLLLPLFLMLPRSIIPNASMTWRSIATLFRAL